MPILRLLLAINFVVLGTLVPMQAQPRPRPVTVANNGIVATSHPLAAQVGLDVLKSGGNAVDAAIATSAAMGLMEPMSCGIGGDLFAIVWDAKTQKLYGLNANGRAPWKATPEYFKSRGLDEIPEKGPLSWSVPGCVDGWEELRKKFGTRSFAELLKPIIRHGNEGVVVPEVIGGYFRSADRNAELRDVYAPGGHAPKFGELFKNPALAKTYQLIAEGGRDAFYKGVIAESLVKYSDAKGGLFQMKDFTEHTSEWIDPVSTNYRGYDVWELPPPGQGIAALQMLNMLEPHDLKKMGRDSADFWHTMIEAKKLAYADRAKFYTDPRFAKVPVKQLISKEYAKKRWELFDPLKALKEIPAGDAKVGQADTIYLCVVDKDRNCVSLIQSNYFGFGSGMAPPELGFAIQNRGTLFALDEKHANRLEPGKRPFHTIIPAMVTKDGKPWLTYGVMGGDMQPQGHVQVLVNLLDFGMNIQEAGEARIEHVGSATPTGKPGDANGGTLKTEYGIPESVVAELSKRGHVVERVRTNGGGYQGILIDPRTGILHGGTESRKDGQAIGY
jgi:gamma-glutamyltranspeptidase / glutathione hydrolase